MLKVQKFFKLENSWVGINLLSIKIKMYVNRRGVDKYLGL